MCLVFFKNWAFRWKQLSGFDFGSCNKVMEIVFSAKSADVSLERRAGSWFENMAQQSHIRTPRVHMTLFSLSPPPPTSSPSPSPGTGALLGSLAEAAPSREAAECRGPGPRQEPKLVSASQHVELACLGHSQMVLQLPLCPPSLSKQRTETN